MAMLRRCRAIRYFGWRHHLLTYEGTNLYLKGQLQDIEALRSGDWTVTDGGWKETGGLQRRSSFKTKHIPGGSGFEGRTDIASTSGVASNMFAAGPLPLCVEALQLELVQRQARVWADAVPLQQRVYAVEDGPVQ